MKHTEGCWSLRVTYPAELSETSFCRSFTLVNHMTKVQVACKENILEGRPTLHCHQMEQTVSVNNPFLVISEIDNNQLI